MKVPEGAVKVLIAILPFYPITTTAQQRLSSAEVEEVIVTGSLGVKELGATSLPISRVTREELIKRGAGGLGEALSTQPGVASSSFGPGASRPIIRGQTGDRVRILENSTVLGDVSNTSDDHAVPVDPIAPDRIEVFRGPGALLYGATAIGGVVNIIDGSIAEAKVGSPVSGTLLGGLGTNKDREQLGAIQLKGDTPFLSWYVSTSQRDTADIGIPGTAESSRLQEQEHEEEESSQKGRVANSSVFSRTWKVGVSHIGESGFLGVAVRGFDSLYGIPGGHEHSEEAIVDQGQEEEERVKINLSQTRIESRGEKRFADDATIEKIRINGSISSYSHKELEGEEIGTKFDNRVFDARLEAINRPIASFKGGFGAQFTHSNFEALGAEAFVPPTRTSVPALFITQEAPLNEVISFQIGSRLELNQIENKGFQSEENSSKRFVPFNASTGLTWSINPSHTAGIHVSYSERAPSATELFANGPHVATQTFDLGNSSIGLERSIGSELSLKKTKGRCTYSVGAFIQEYNNYINLSSTGNQEEGLPVFQFDQTQARFTGSESRIQYALLSDTSSGSLDLGGGLDYVYAQDLRTNDPLPRIPPLRGQLSLTFQRSKFSARVEGLFAASQNRNQELELPTDGYQVLNLHTSYKMPVGKRWVGELFLRGTNLTNEEIRYHTSFIKDIVPARGRAVLGGVQFSF